MEFSGQYLTYEEYRALGGTKDLAPFNLLEFNARKLIDMYTFGRLTELEEQVMEVKMCVFKLITQLDQAEESSKAQANGIQSESIDGYSVSYGGITSETIQAKRKQAEATIKQYLSDCKLEDGTPYLYIGVDKNAYKFKLDFIPQEIR